MKITKDRTFSPVTIKLETEYDLIAFRFCLRWPEDLDDVEVLRNNAADVPTAYVLDTLNELSEL